MAKDSDQLSGQFVEVERLPESQATTSDTQVVQNHARLISWMVIAILSFLYFVQTMSIVAAGFLGQPIIRVVGGAGQSAWLSMSVTIGVAALGPVICQLADFWGRKWLLVALAAIGFAGCMVVSRADTFAMAIVGFTLISIACCAAGLSHAVVSEILQRGHRPYAQGAVNSSAALGGIVTTLMGGVLVRNNPTNYRTVFYLAAAMFGVSGLALVWFYQPPKRHIERTYNFWQKICQLDWIAYGLLGPGLILFCVALAWSRNPYEWSNAHVLAPFVLSIVLLVALVVYEGWFRMDGLLHHGLFLHRNFPLALTCMAIEGLVFFTFNTYYAFEISVLDDADTLRIGVRYAIFFIVASAVPIITGWFSTRMKQLRIPMVVGFLCFAVFNSLMAATNMSTSGASYWGYPVILGLGVGILLPTIMVVAQLGTTGDLISVASGLILSSRAVGATVGVAINTALFNRSLSHDLLSKVAAATLPLGLPESSLGTLIGALTSGNSPALQKIPGITEEILGAAAVALREAYMLAFRNLWIFSASFAGFGALCSMFVVDQKDQFNQQIDAPLHEHPPSEKGLNEGPRGPNSA